MGRRRKKGRHISGWINLDKPEGISSTSAVNKVRYLLNAKKAGHAGTLDPLATGILPIALGEATKTIPYCQNALKGYRFTVNWGEETNTGDAEGHVTETSDHRPEKTDITAILSEFTGKIEQVPPRFSAIKIDGQRAYELARKGKAPKMKPRTVYVKSLTMIESDTDQAKLDCICGKGTYIRAIGRDMARALGTRGYVTGLRRTAVGPFMMKTAISLAKIEDIHHSAQPEDLVNEILLPVETALDDIPALHLDGAEAARLRHGQTLKFVSRPDVERLKESGIQIDRKEQTVLVMHDSNPVAIASVNGVNISPDRVFNMA